MFLFDIPLMRDVISASTKNAPKPNQKVLSIKSAVGLPIESVGGITYDPVTGRPLSFDASYDGPKNALVGELNADNGQSYGIMLTINKIIMKFRIHLEM